MCSKSAFMVALEQGPSDGAGAWEDCRKTENGRHLPMPAVSVVVSVGERLSASTRRPSGASPGRAPALPQVLRPDAEDCENEDG